MATLSDLLHIGASGLNAYQNQISVYGNNIANVNTDGYSRRTARTVEAYNADGYGTGVQGGDVVRLYNALGNTALLQEQSNASYNTELASYLSQLETLAGSTGSTGFDAALSAFQNALQDATSQPEDLATRTSLLQSAATLASEMNALDSRMEGLLTDDGALASPQPIVNEINALTERMETLNRNIVRANVAGRSAPDLLDERDGVVRELSKLVNISVSPDYQISLGGQPLVSADGMTRVELSVGAGNVFSVGGVDVGGSITNGKLAAMLSAQGSATTYSNQLDFLASTIIAQTNSIFDVSYNLNGQRPADLGYSFFSGTSASDIAVDPALLNPANAFDVHPELVALASTASVGDNAGGQALFNMLQQPQATLDGRSIATFWENSQATLGGAIREARQLSESCQTVVSALDNEMLSVSGVNLDEELMNLMSAQNAYQACARVLSTANALLDELINLAR